MAKYKENIAPELPVIIGLDTKDRSTDDHALFDPRITLPLDENILANIQEFGVKIPPLLEEVKDEETGEVQLLVVDGRQRIRYAREINKRLKKIGEPPRSIPVLIQKNTDENDLVALQSGLNDGRVGDDLLGLAERAAMFKRRSTKIEDIAVAMCKTPNTIRNYLKIHALPSDVKRGIKDGRITVSAGLELAKKTEEDRARILDAATPVLTPEEQALAKGNDGTDVQVEGKAEEHKPRVKINMKPKAVSAREIRGELTPKKYREAILKTLEQYPKMPAQFKLGVQFAFGLKQVADLPGVLKEMFEELAQPGVPEEPVVKGEQTEG